MYVSIRSWTGRHVGYPEATRPAFTREGAGMVVPSSFLQSQTAVRVDILCTVVLVLLDFLRESDPEVTMGTGLSLRTVVFYRSGD